VVVNICVPVLSFLFSDDRAKKAKAENWLAQFNISIPTAHANTVKTANIEL
jgi:hypothetical protein